MFGIAGNPSARPYFARLFPEPSAKKSVKTGAKIHAKKYQKKWNIPAGPLVRSAEVDPILEWDQARNGNTEPARL